MKTTILSFSLLFSIVIIAQQPYKQTLKLMGSHFEITVVAKDSIEANNNIKSLKL